jgi:hypothetical protein
LTADIINKALEVAENYPVFPCNSKKQPLCKWREAATQDPNKIEMMFSNPNAKLIGMPTGLASGISVIDIDVNNGKQGKKWLEDNRDKLGNTLYAQTQSGGWHFYYNHKDGLANAAGLGNGAVDIRGEGGYVITSPSDGYKFLNDEDLIDFPDFLLGSSLPEVATPNNTAPVTDMFGSITDGREKYMSDLVFASIMNFRKENNGSLPSEEYMVENVWTIYALKVKSRDSRGLDAEDRGIKMFMKKVRSTLAKLSRKDAPVLGEFDDPEPMPEYIDDSKVDSTTGQRKYRIPAIVNTALEDLPPPRFILPPYLLSESLAVLYGSPASFKSFLSLAWALSIAHGIDFNGRAVEYGWAIYLSLEGSSGVLQRIQAWHRDNGLQFKDAKFVSVCVGVDFAQTPVNDPNNESDVYDLMGSVNQAIKASPLYEEGDGIKLVVVDTLARAFTSADSDENNANSMSIFVKNCDILAQAWNCCVLAVHHAGKDSAKGMRGSSALLGAVSSSFEIKRQSDSMVTCLKTTKQKDAEEAEPLYLEAQEVSWHEALGVEQTSLVLDPRDAPPKKQFISGDQGVALDILDSLLQDDNVVEKDRLGNVGVPESLFRDVVIQSLPNHSERRSWHKFKKRLENKEFIKVLNGLVSKVNV